MVEIIPALIVLAYVLLLVILLVIVWRDWRALTDFKKSLEMSHRNEEKYFPFLANNIDVLVRNQRHTLDEGQRLIEKLKDMYDLSAKAAENESLQNQIQEAESQSLVRESELQKISQEKDEAVKELEKMQGEFNALEILNSEQLKEKEDLKAQVAGYEACLPVDHVDRLYREVGKVCDLREVDGARIHYVFSRLAFMAAIKELNIKEEDKQIMLRDAFDKFDKALYAQFKDKKTLLQSLRDCFQEGLKPLLDGQLTFRWPVPNDALNGVEHTQEEDSGGEIITEVKSAVVFESKGTVLSKAIVRT